MAIRIKHKVWINTARDTDMKDLVYGPNETERLTQTDTFDQWDGASFNVAAAANQDLDLSGITKCKGFFLQASGDVKLTINGAVVPIQLRRANATGAAVARILIEADITAINVANDTAASITGHFHAWGSST